MLIKLTGAVAIIALLMMIIGCVKKNAAPKDMTFSVNYELLGQRYTNNELELSFQPPKNWEDLTEYVAERVLDNADIEYGDTPPQIVKVYVSQEHSSSFSLFDYSKSLPENDFTDSMNTLISNLTHDKNVLRDGYFSYNDFIFRQLTILDNGVVNIKLFGRKNDREKLFLLDYLIDSKEYENILETIESSIGSIKQI